MRIQKQKKPEDEFFVTCAYKGILWRDPDKSGLKNYIDQLRNNVISRDQMLTTFFKSDEYINNTITFKIDGTNEGYIKGLYNRLLGRSGEFNEVRDLVRLLEERKLSRIQVFYQFYKSHEFNQKHQNEFYQPKVFISYVHENSKEVRRLRKALEGKGIKVWQDIDGIDVGKKWKRVIRKAIQDGDFFIACFSKEYCSKNKTYMNEELMIAIEELRLRPTDTNWFLPILLANCIVPDIEIRPGETLRDIQAAKLYVDFKNEFERIVKVIFNKAYKIDGRAINGKSEQHQMIQRDDEELFDDTTNQAFKNSSNNQKSDNLQIKEKENQSIIIKDTEIKTEVKNADEAIGMEVNKPAQLLNVKSELKADNVKRAVGFSTNQGLTTIISTCTKCKKPFPIAYTGSPPPTINCPYCGEIKVV